MFDEVFDEGAPRALKTQVKPYEAGQMRFIQHVLLCMHDVFQNFLIQENFLRHAGELRCDFKDSFIFLLCIFYFCQQ